MILLILLAAVVTAFHFSASDLIDRRLRAWVPTLVPGISMEWESFEILPFTLGIRFKQMSIQWKNPAEPGTTIGFAAEILEIQGIDLAALLITGKWSLREVRTHNWSCVVKGEIGDILSGGISGSARNAVTVDRWRLGAGTFSWSENNKSEGGVEARLENMEFVKNLGKGAPVMRQLNAGPVRFEFPAAMADVIAKKIAFDRKKRNLEVHDLDMEPHWPENEFGIHKGFQTDRVGFHIARLNASWKGERGSLPVSGPYRLMIQNPRLEIFRDRRIDRKPGPRKQKLPPYRLLRQFPFMIHIPEILIKDGEINYAEHQKGAPRPGRLLFSQFSAKISGFQAGSVESGSSHPIHMEFNCRFQGKIPFFGGFAMDTGKPDFRFSGKLGAIELPALNTMLIPMAFLRIENGKMGGAQWSLKGNDHHLSGWMKAKYRKLRITLLKHQQSPRKRGLATFLVNLLVFRNNPEQGESLRTARIYLERNPGRGFFNWVWRGILDGLKRSAGI